MPKLHLLSDYYSTRLLTINLPTATITRKASLTSWSASSSIPARSCSSPPSVCRRNMWLTDYIRRACYTWTWSDTPSTSRSASTSEWTLSVLKAVRVVDIPAMFQQLCWSQLLCSFARGRPAPWLASRCRSLPRVVFTTARPLLRLWCWAPAPSGLEPVLSWLMRLVHQRHTKRLSELLVTMIISVQSSSPEDRCEYGITLTLQIGRRTALRRSRSLLARVSFLLSMTLRRWVMILMMRYASFLFFWYSLANYLCRQWITHDLSSWVRRPQLWTKRRARRRWSTN